MKDPIRVVQFGLGPIGIEAARTVLSKEQTGRVELVGAIDIDPDKIGRDVAELLDEEEATGITVSEDADRVLKKEKPDVVIHSTTSFLEDMHEQLKQCARAGAHVISSTEELAFPYERHPELSQQLDEVARANDVVILGTGVNPGYAMDTLALAATGVCSDVDRVYVERVVDASQRRLPLQKKVGAGLLKAAFEEKKATGKFGHIGLRESLQLLADGLGWPMDELEESLEPIVAERFIETPFLEVKEGEVAGIHHRISGYVDGEELLSLNLKMYVGAESQHDAVEVVGNPPIELVVKDGIFGDTATVAALVNALPLVMEVRPGLRTMKDMPVPRAFATFKAQSIERTFTVNV